MNKKIIGYSLLLIILITLLAMQVTRMSNQYSVWKGNYDFLESENKTIQPWMTVNLINRYFDLDYEYILEKLDLDNTKENRRVKLQDYCGDCIDYIHTLEND